MVCIAPLQYAWTLFAVPLDRAHPWSLAQVQLAFTFFVVAQTLSQPVGGLFMDRRGPRLAYVAAALMIVVGWGTLGFVETRVALYGLYGVAGVGAGIVYAGAIGTGIRWFPDRRGLALGLITAGFGAGAAPFIPFVQQLLDAYGLRAGFLVTGAVSAAAVLAVGLLLRAPDEGSPPPAAAAPATASAAKTPVAAPAATTPVAVPAATTVSTPASREATAGRAMESDPTSDQPGPLALLRLGQFWMAFVAFFCMATGLLILTANAKPIGLSFGIATGVIVAAVSLQQVLNGASRVAWGWVSDRLGRAPTMALAFALNGAVLCLIPLYGETPAAFVVLTALAFFTSGEIFALFPALTADRFGSRYAAANQGMLYTAKGLASLAGGALAAWLAATQSWTLVFLLAAGLAFLSSLLMLALGARARTT
jgi:MFS transporter, OFA family, oxalate/formate antiporter